MPIQTFQRVLAKEPGIPAKETELEALALARTDALLFLIGLRKEQSDPSMIFLPKGESYDVRENLLTYRIEYEWKPSVFG